jgi:hypothetical protein
MGVDVHSHIFLTSTLDGGERLLSPHTRLLLEENIRYPLVRSLGGPQSRTARCGKRNYLLTLAGLHSYVTVLSIQYSCSCVEWAIPAMFSEVRVLICNWFQNEYLWIAGLWLLEWLYGLCIRGSWFFTLRLLPLSNRHYITPFSTAHNVFGFREEVVLGILFQTIAEMPVSLELFVLVAAIIIRPIQEYGLYFNF